MSTIITILSAVIAVLVLVAAGVGLVSPGDPDSQFDFTTVRGQTARMYGEGIYEFDTVFFAAGFRGQDAVALFLGLPLLIISILLYRQGGLAGHFLIVGVLGYFLYVYASMALGAAYNRLFLVYIGIFAASLYAFLLAFASIDLSQVSAVIGEGLPANGLAIFMILAGAVTAFVWGAPLVDSLLKGVAPDRMDTYTTMVTYAIDLAVITPATFLCAFLVLRGEPLGYVIAAPLLTLIVLLAPQIILSTVFQRAAGVPFTAAEMIGPVAGFVVLGVSAGWLLWTLLRGLARAV